MPVIKQKKTIEPTKLIVLSFLLVIVTGTILLSLPISSRDHSFTHPIDALFTATSATCVTGLAVYDTYSHWNTFGQVVIMLMLQIGGLGLVTFTSFFTFVSGKKMGLRSMQAASESVNTTGFSDVKQLVKSVMIISAICESIGAVLLMIYYVPKYGPKGIFFSFFHAISAFTNGGFDLMGIEVPGGSLAPVSSNPLVMFTIMALIVAGGMGFVVWTDIRNYGKTKKLVMQTKIVLIMTAILIVSGTVIFAVLEWNNPETIGNCGTGQKIVHSLFQSITFRTAGFSTVDIGKAEPLTKLAAICYMFIGVAPGSTGGGIKITTVAIVICTVISVVRNQPDTVMLGRRINKDLVYKSLSIIVLSATVTVISSLIFVHIGKAYDISVIDAVFEAASAFSTCGLSAGYTAVPDTFSRLILCLTMFIGRVGPVSFAISLTLGADKRPKNEVIPEGKLFV